MKKILSSFLFMGVMFLCNSAKASTFTLDYVLIVEDHPPIKGSIQANEGENVVVKAENIALYLIPTKQGDDLIKIQADLWEKTTTTQGVHAATANFITKLNQSAEFTEFKKDGTPKYKLDLSLSAN